MLLGGVPVTMANAAEVSRIDLHALQLETSAGHTRAIVGLSATAQFRAFALRNPDRVVLDLQDTTLRSGVVLPLGDGTITSVRAGRHPGGMLRLVFDTTAFVAPYVSNATDPAAQGATLVIDFGAAPASKQFVVAIDAGHGGSDLGSLGRAGSSEKNLALTMARELAERITKEPDMRAILIRSRDEFITLRDRCARAEQLHADLLLSIHADSTGNPDTGGVALYVNAESAAAASAASWLADRENGAESAPSPQSASINETSRRIAAHLLRAFQPDTRLQRADVQQGSFAVLNSTTLPAILLSVGFISNRDDEQRLAQRGHRAKLVDAILRGLRNNLGASAPDNFQLVTTAESAQR